MQMQSPLPDTGGTIDIPLLTSNSVSWFCISVKKQFLDLAAYLRFLLLHPDHDRGLQILHWGLPSILLMLMKRKRKRNPDIARSGREAEDFCVPQSNEHCEYCCSTRGTIPPWLPYFPHFLGLYRTPKAFHQFGNERSQDGKGIPPMHEFQAV